MLFVLQDAGEFVLHCAVREMLTTIVQTMCAYGCKVDITTKVRTTLIQSIHNISNSDILNSAKLEASIWIKNTFWLLSPTMIWRCGLFYKSRLPDLQINLHFRKFELVKNSPNNFEISRVDCITVVLFGSLLFLHLNLFLCHPNLIWVIFILVQSVFHNFIYALAQTVQILIRGLLQ